MHRDQRRHTKSPFVFLTYFRARTFGRYHDHRNVIPNLHTFFDNIEAVRIRKARILLHQRHNLCYHSCMLFVWRQVKN